MADKISDTFISAVCIFDNQSINIASKMKRLAGLLKGKYANYEIVIIDNGVNLEESMQIEGILDKVACIRILRLSKVEEIDTAVFAGVEAAIGDYVSVIYNNDPIENVNKMTQIVRKSKKDIIFGIASNLRRKNILEDVGAKVFYWYNRKFLKIDIPPGATYSICLNRTAVNALTRSDRYSKHIRYLTKQIGFKTSDYIYKLPSGGEVYNRNQQSLVLRAINLVSGYSSHPLRSLTYLGIVAGMLNLAYTFYVVIVNISSNDLAKGWTTLSLQVSGMFFLTFIIMAMLSEYIGQILQESRREDPYHIKEELSSKISVADETRRNITK